MIGVDNRTPDEQLAQGLRVTLKPEGRPLVVVDLAPGWYLKQQGLHFSERDRLSVEGASGSGDPVQARSVTKGAVTVRLRDAAGRPFWDTASAEHSSPAPASP